MTSKSLFLGFCVCLLCLSPAFSQSLSKNESKYLKEICLDSNKTCNVFIVNLTKNNDIINIIKNAKYNISKNSYLYVFNDKENYQRKIYWNEAVNFIYETLINPLAVNQCSLVKLSGHKFVDMTPSNFSEYVLILTPDNKSSRCITRDIEFKATPIKQ